MKKVFKVFYSQLLNSFFPLLIVFILLKLKDKENVGNVLLLINYANFYLLFSDYSANISFLKDALNNGGINISTNSSIIKNIEHYLGIKFIVLAFGFILWGILCFTVSALKEHSFANLFAYSFIIGYNLNYYWIYMCSNKEHYFIISNFLSRISLLLLLVIFVFTNNSFTWLMATVGFVSTFITIVYFRQFCKKFNLSPNFNRNTILLSAQILKRDFNLMISNFFLMTPTLSLNFFSGYIKPIGTIPIYGFAEKIFYLIRSTLSIFINSVYPGLCNKQISGKRKYLIFAFFYTCIIIGCLILFWSKHYITNYLKFSVYDATLFNKCLNYFILTILILSINVPFMLWALTKDILLTKASIAVFSIACTLIIATFIVTSTFLQGAANALPIALFINESLIVLGFFILYVKFRRPSSS